MAEKTYHIRPIDNIVGWAITLDATALGMLISLQLTGNDKGGLVGLLGARLLVGLIAKLDEKLSGDGLSEKVPTPHEALQPLTTSFGEHLRRDATVTNNDMTLTLPSSANK